ncbi:hypothetical protein CLIM01_08662 [Colletotrichum limetticola]|uniref:Uncharacterized protein n=1 Tax=Colletotrichum limetticola TaxID=1209924 RepID=A0ABQ9PR17_9PEZI|nr:hypothetical protein CLIM01_08662 [Colletotrichum limetticola]
MLSSKSQLPGFGLPLNHAPEDHFPDAVSDWEQRWPHTNRERCMIAFIQEVTLEKDWNQRVFQEAALATWKDNLMERDWHRAGEIRHGDFTDAMFEYCIDELQEKARLYNETGVVPVLDVQVRIARSDRVISSDMRSTLQKAVGNIERTLSHKTDRSSGKENSLAEAKGSTCKKQNNVINVIDPTMYPLVFGRSRVLPTHEIDLHNCLGHISQGITIKVPGQKETQKYVDGIYHTLFSSQSQWLPCNIEFPDGINAKITSYINNLHPREHITVYSVLENIITQIMPMWNMVYSSVYDHTMRCDLRIDCTEAGWKYPNTPPYDPLNIRDDLMNGVIDDDEWQRRTDEWLCDFRVVDRPEPQVKEDRALQRSSHEHNDSVTPQGMTNFTGMLGKAGGIQIVVKIRAMYPTPENPICDLQNEFGLDGALNEHIVATAVYFFEDENVTDSNVSFQTRFQGLNFEEDCTFVVGDLRPLDEIFGLRHKTPSLQKIGSATMREGLVLVCPNVMQQKESAFQLKDPTQPGHRKVLTLYLVDPRVKILSTANVPPQQADWWAAEFTSREGQMKGLPKEVVEMVVENVTDFPIPKQEARNMRDELLLERSTLESSIRGILGFYRIDLDWGDSDVDYEDSSGGED